MCKDPKARVSKRKASVETNKRVKGLRGNIKEEGILH